jgi:hypothetical protein
MSRRHTGPALADDEAELEAAGLRREPAALRIVPIDATVCFAETGTRAPNSRLPERGFEIMN